MTKAEQLQITLRNLCKTNKLRPSEIRIGELTPYDNNPDTSFILATLNWDERYFDKLVHTAKFDNLIADIQKTIHLLPNVTKLGLGTSDGSILILPTYK